MPKPGEVMDHVWGSQLNDKKELARKWKGTTSDPNTDFPSAEEGDVCLDYSRKAFREFVDNLWKTQGIPSNLIGIWDQSTPPAGWYICDGNNGTPDIRGRFVRGASSSTGTTGGSSTVSHTHTTIATMNYSTSGKATSPENNQIRIGLKLHSHNTSSSTAQINLIPPYLALYFIMKG